MPEDIFEEAVEKARGQLRLKLNAVLSVFNKYGMGVYIAGAAEAMIGLADIYAARIDGLDIEFPEMDFIDGFSGVT